MGQKPDDVVITGSDGLATSRIARVARSEALAALNKVALPLMGTILIGISAFFGHRFVSSLDILSQHQTALAQKLDDLHEADQARLASMDSLNSVQTVKLDLLATNLATETAVLAALQQRFQDNQADVRDRFVEVKQAITNAWQAISQIQRNQKPVQTQ